jgi:hypothetical protein
MQGTHIGKQENEDYTLWQHTGHALQPKRIQCFLVKNHSASPFLSYHLQPGFGHWQQDAGGSVRSSGKTVVYVEMLLLFPNVSFLIAAQLAWHQGRYMSPVLLGAIELVVEQARRPLESSGGRSNVP